MSTKDLDSLAQEIAQYIKNVAPDNVVEQITGQSTKPGSFSEFKNKPIDFIQDVLGITLWEKQKEITRLFLDNRFVSIEAAHGVGKSFGAAALAVYWLCVHEDTALLVTSAPTASQVNSVLWRAMRQHKEHARQILPGEIFLTPQWRISSDRQGIGLSPRKNSEFDVASLQGRHDPHLLVILDEAGGLTLPLWNATISLVTGEENKFLAIGNPIAKSGPFYESTRSQNFKSIRISCFDHPNVVQHKDIIPGSVSWNWVNERVNDWCRPVSTPSQKTIEWLGKYYTPLPVFESKVLGRPPDEAESQLIFLEWVEAAIQRGMVESQVAGERVMGLDVAYGGSSESALAYRVSDALQWIKRNRLNDTTQITEWAKSEMDEHEVERMFIDTTGGYGLATHDSLRDQGYPVEGINFAQSAMQRTKYTNMRCEMWWSVREVLRTGQASLPDDDFLRGDLVSPLHDHDNLGRVRIEDKDQIIKRLGRSPDSGDAYALTYAGATLGTEGIAENYVDSLTTKSVERESGGPPSRWSISRPRIGKSRWRFNQNT